jgi:hypothetical protein
MVTGSRRRDNGEQRVAALAFDVAESDLPLRVAFPLLMANTIHWLSGEQPAMALTIQAGETLPLAADQTLWTEPATKAAQSASPRHPAEIARNFFQPLHNGYYQLEGSNGVRWIAVNTFSAAESDLRQGGASAPPAPPANALSFVSMAGWPLWQYLALAALMLFTLEWWLFHRRCTE